MTTQKNMIVSSGLTLFIVGTHVEINVIVISLTSFRYSISHENNLMKILWNKYYQSSIELF